MIDFEIFWFVKYNLDRFASNQSLQETSRNLIEIKKSTEKFSASFRHEIFQKILWFYIRKSVEIRLFLPFHTILPNRGYRMYPLLAQKRFTTTVNDWKHIEFMIRFKQQGSIIGIWFMDFSHSSTYEHLVVRSAHILHLVFSSRMRHLLAIWSFIHLESLVTFHFPY